jgi:hypothetical protein
MNVWFPKKQNISNSLYYNCSFWGNILCHGVSSFPWSLRGYCFMKNKLLGPSFSLPAFQLRPQEVLQVSRFCGYRLLHRNATVPFFLILRRNRSFRRRRNGERTITWGLSLLESHKIYYVSDENEAKLLHRSRWTLRHNIYHKIPPMCNHILKLAHLNNITTLRSYICSYISK